MLQCGEVETVQCSSQLFLPYPGTLYSAAILSTLPFPFFFSSTGMIFFCSQMFSHKRHFNSLPFLFFRLEVSLTFFFFFLHREKKNPPNWGTDFEGIEMNPLALDLLMPLARTYQRAPKMSSDASPDSLL